MPKVFTQFIRPKTIPTNPGDHYLDLYQEQYTKKGDKEIIKVGEKNIYEMIQADLEGTKIENILHAMAMGDLSALQQREAVYYDATTMPKTLMEAQNMIVKAKEDFEAMPMEVKNLFSNNPDKYLAEMGTEEFFKKMAPYNKKIKEIEEAGSLKEYNKKVAEAAKFNKDVNAAMGEEAKQ